MDNRDSQEYIENLGKAGGGLSKGRAYFLRHFGFPFVNAVISWERALSISEREGRKMIALARALPKEKMNERVLIPHLFGLEDNSRYYSVAMVLKHVLIVGSALQKRVPLLSQGKKLDKEVKIEEYKPYEKISAKIIDDYEMFLNDFRATMEAEVEDIFLDNRHKHPWFGNLKAKEWGVMGAIHQIVHRRQMEAIIKGLSAEIQN